MRTGFPIQHGGPIAKIKEKEVFDSVTTLEEDPGHDSESQEGRIYPIGIYCL